MTFVLDDILAFWFDAAAEPFWFQRDPGFDERVRDQLLAPHQAAAAGELGGWRDQSRGCLALVILLDQVPRNLFRNTARAFATDAAAHAVAVHALERGFDLALAPSERLFIYLPFEHSETMADQDRAVALFQERIGDPASTAAALSHRHIIERFGRFPHRNRALGRITTAEEARFLTEPNSSF